MKNFSVILVPIILDRNQIEYASLLRNIFTYLLRMVVISSIIIYWTVLMTTLHKDNNESLLVSWALTQYLSE
jgi:hypothetical protein